MTRHRHHHSAWQILADMNMLFFMWAVSLVTMLIISYNVQVHTKGDIISKAEYLLILTWDKDRDVDLDMWVETPSGIVVMYTNKEAKNISLDRDSRGFQTNDTVLPDGTHSRSINQEVVTIRSIVPGDYIVAISYYDGADKDSNIHYEDKRVEDKATIDAIFEIDKVNPKFRQVGGANVTLTRVKETRNLIAFHVDDKGEYTLLPLPEENMIHRIVEGKGSGN